MAEKKKAYQRFEELTRQATGPRPAEAEAAGDSMTRRRPSEDAGMGPPGTEGVPIRLSPELRQALERRAAADDTTPSEIVHEAIRRYLEVPR